MRGKGPLSPAELALKRLQELTNTENPYDPSSWNKPQKPVVQDTRFRRQYHLLLSHVPQVLSNCIRFEEYQFIGYRQQHGRSRLRLTKIMDGDFFGHPLQDNLIEQLAGMCRCQGSDMLRGLQSVFSRPEILLSKLSNPCSRLNYAIEHAISACFHQNMTPVYGDPSGKKYDLAHFLLEQGCSRNFVKNTANVHYSSMVVQDGDYAEPRSRRRRQNFLECMAESGKALCIMMMINLYLMCQRVLTDHRPSREFRDVKHAHPSDEVHLSIAAGVYFCVGEIADTCLDPKSCPAVPGFEDFHEILGYAVRGQSFLVGCSHCDTCYLKFSDDILRSRALQRFVRQLRCPCCGQDVSYDLSDG